jgi:hypothetical protein
MFTEFELTLDKADFAEVAPLSEVRDDLVIRGNLHLAVSASDKPKLRGTKLITIHHHRSEEGQIKPITAKAGRAQTRLCLIQLNCGPQQTASVFKLKPAFDGQADFRLLSNVRTSERKLLPTVT